MIEQKQCGISSFFSCCLFCYSRRTIGATATSQLIRPFQGRSTTFERDTGMPTRQGKYHLPCLPLIFQQSQPQSQQSHESQQEQESQQSQSQQSRSQHSHHSQQQLPFFFPGDRAAENWLRGLKKWNPHITGIVRTNSEAYKKRFPRMILTGRLWASARDNRLLLESTGFGVSNN